MGSEELRHVDSWKRLLAPALLGLAAAGLYWKSLYSQLEPVSFVQVASAIDPYAPIQVSQLKEIKVHGDAASLAQGALRWSQLGRVKGAKAARRLHAGELLRFSDVELEQDRMEYALRENEEVRYLQLPEGNRLVDPDVQPGDTVRAHVRTSDGSTVYVGPFYVLGLKRTSKDGEVSIGTLILVTRRPDDDTPDPEFDRLLGAVNPHSRGEAEQLQQIIRFNPSPLPNDQEV